VSAGSVASVKETFTAIERENEELRKRLAAGAAVMELDPNFVDPSPVADRLRDDGDGAFEAFKQSIADRGQEVPILVRPHPKKEARYQCAYGHRRLRATRDLGLVVKAIVRDLTDEELVVAQGLENAAREDLSFIERAAFAMRIEDAGHSRSVIQHALSIDKAEASKLLGVARAVPAELLTGIGRAPKIGRPRWLALVEQLQDAAALKRAMAALAEPGFEQRETDARFAAVLAACLPKIPPTTRKEARQVMSADGRKIGRAHRAEREVKLMIDEGVSPHFAAFVVDQLPALFDEFSRSQEREEDTAT
jgi:ParB family chromosome partitioning protein